MCTFKWIAVTARKICSVPLPEQISYLAESEDKPDMVILREKDLEEREYKELAWQIKGICEKAGICFVPHNFYHAARELGCESIHLPLAVLEKTVRETGKLTEFSLVGASVHSVEEAIQAYKLGATYLTAGHIFQTDCKKGLPGRGLDFLTQICGAVPIPVYAIGGIRKEQETFLKEAGAKGACRMSDYMKQLR
ncbi:MAG: thiamine phosphate synthase [Lachnospiraceae bacterium]|nr:thiamine phosphate synthase [Lachnospiraceae bacterium]